MLIKRVHLFVKHFFLVFTFYRHIKLVRMHGIYCYCFEAPSAHSAFVVYCCTVTSSLSFRDIAPLAVCSERVSQVPTISIFRTAVSDSAVYIERIASLCVAVEIIVQHG